MSPRIEPRQYGFRRSQLQGAVATSWAIAMVMPALALLVWLKLPLIVWLSCAISAVTGVGLFTFFARRARREWQGCVMPPSSYRVYFDRHDPSVFSDRGTNLGSVWSWALFVSPVVLFMLPLLL